jgi:hypothetical protein
MYTISFHVVMKISFVYKIFYLEISIKVMIFKYTIL